MNKFYRFAEWLWSKKDREVAFRISTLTESNSHDDETLPSPPLSRIEAETLFRHLENLHLVYPVPDPQGGTAFLINKTRPHEWENEISELKKPKWRRSSVFTIAAKGVGIIFLGYVGAVIEKHVDKLSKGPLKPPVEEPANSKERSVSDPLKTIPNSPKTN